MDEILKLIESLIVESECVTGNRVSIINGLYDFSQYSAALLEHAHLVLEHFKSDETITDSKLGECVARIILAEVYYQNNDCYKALVMINGALAYLEKENNTELWIVARYVQMCIMIVEGQLDTIFPIVDSLKQRVEDTNNPLLIQNYEALCVWCALYDDNDVVIDSWMKSKAPNEFGAMNLDDMFVLLVKARVYFSREKYLAMITLLQFAVEVLKGQNRQMEICECYSLIAMGYWRSGNKEDAFAALDVALEIGKERKTIRLFADEGEHMYRLMRAYVDNRKKMGLDLQMEKQITELCKKMALLYPGYLRHHKTDYPALSQKELEVLQLMADQRTNAEIADFVGTSNNTVKFHAKNIFRKLGVENRVQAVKVGLEERYITDRGILK